MKRRERREGTTDGLWRAKKPFWVFFLLCCLTSVCSAPPPLFFFLFVVSLGKQHLALLNPRPSISDPLFRLKFLNLKIPFLPTPTNNPRRKLQTLSAVKFEKTEKKNGERNVCFSLSLSCSLSSRRSCFNSERRGKAITLEVKAGREKVVSFHLSLPSFSLFETKKKKKL